MAGTGADFPCTLTIHTPFPTHRLASAALGALAVDKELSALVQRDFSLVLPSTSNTITSHRESSSDANSEKTVLRTEYKATTNRMLRVAVNGFFESLNLVIQVMEELDVDVVKEKGLESLEGVQGVEQGLVGTTVTGA